MNSYQATVTTLHGPAAQDSIEFGAGRVYWRSIRDFVNKAQFTGRHIEMWEGSGWVSRQFMIKGDSDLIRQLRRCLTEQSQDISS